MLKYPPLTLTALAVHNVVLGVVGEHETVAATSQAGHSANCSSKAQLSPFLPAGGYI